MALREGTDLETLAEEQGVDYASVTDAVVDSVRSSLKTAVADGRIEQERADAILSGVQEWLADGGDLRACLRGGRPGGPFDGGEWRQPDA